MSSLGSVQRAAPSANSSILAPLGRLTLVALVGTILPAVSLLALPIIGGICLWKNLQCQKAWAFGRVIGQDYRQFTGRSLNTMVIPESKNFPKLVIHSAYRHPLEMLQDGFVLPAEEGEKRELLAPGTGIQRLLEEDTIGSSPFNTAEDLAWLKKQVQPLKSCEKWNTFTRMALKSLVPIIGIFWALLSETNQKKKITSKAPECWTLREALEFHLAILTYKLANPIKII